MPIPIENIYFLLCYAWNKLDEKERVDVSIDDKTKLLDLFAKVLITSSKILLKRGIDKSYIDHEEEFLGIKGKIRISETVKRNLFLRQKTVCTYDDFSINILTNQILVSTIYRLRTTRNLDPALKMELGKIQKMFLGVDRIEVKKEHFKHVRLTRNNRFYGFVMDVCYLIYESTFPSEQKGTYTFSDFTRDDRKMNLLFEAFVRNFYKIEQRKFDTVKKEVITWRFDQRDCESYQYLPQMETDISLENLDQKVIIDTKYYRETMTTNYDREKIRSSNLYQLFSYLLNQEDDGNEKTKATTGILLYPTVENDYDLDFQYKHHKIQIRTVNLKANWRSISTRLKEIIHI